MPHSLTARNYDLTPQVRDYVEKKVDRLRKVYVNIQKIEVILTGQKHHGEADLIVEARHGTLKCATKNENPVAAFDVAMDKMERQLERHKSRLRGNKKHPRDAARAARGRAGAIDEGVPEEAMAAIADVEALLPHPRPIRMRRMSLQEALDAFERAAYEVLVYLDEETERPRILFRDEAGENTLLEVVGEG
ncbi:MAG: ribosome-associated translation inhibitor RaiA [Candidatus Sumerlaeota bacterium]|nr:ribosome-associated translation inhibitor RaiA [Candidatus Sumerlaeota bacterium]